MKNLKKLATFCCFMLIAFSALTLSSCKKDDGGELTPKAIITSRQWSMPDADMPTIIDIDYSSKGNVIMAMFYEQLAMKQTMPITSFTEGDFDGYQFMLSTPSSLIGNAYIKVIDENTITIKTTKMSEPFTLIRVEEKVDLSKAQEVNFEDLM